MKIIALFGGSTRHKSLAVTAQRRLNCYYENRPDQDKSKVVIFGTPGLVPAFVISSTLNLPVRGITGTENALYAVSYNQFLSLNPTTGAQLATGNINTFSGAVSLAVSPTQVVIVDGSTGYLYDTVLKTVTVIAPWQATGARTCTFVSGFFVAEQPGTQNFWVSNVFDGSTWNALAFSAAAADSDTIRAVDQLNGNLIVFMTQGMEFWVNQGLFPEPFVPLPSASNTFGLAAILSRVHCDQAILFLAESTQGVAQLARLDGYNVTVISDSDVEAIWNSYPRVDDAVGLTYQRDKHIFYQITFPSANDGAGASWLYDCSTRLMSEVQTGPSVSPVRHTAQLSTYAAGQILLTDDQTNQIYTMSDTAYTDAGAVIVREIVTRHVLSQFNRIRVSLLYLDMETGVGLQNGQGSNPQVMVQHSTDNGHTWGPERWMSLGPVGQYLTRLGIRRFKSGRDHLWRIRMTDPVKFVITEGAIKLNERQPAEKLG